MPAPRLILKRALQSRLGGAFPPLLVASPGRSGSTLLYDALCSAMASERFKMLGDLGRRIVSDSAWRLSGRRLHDGVVYKTHALADELPKESQAKVLFVYRRPSRIVLSVLAADNRYGNDWTQEHLSHLQATGPLHEVARTDVLRIEEQIDGWLSSKQCDVLGVRYESLWENLEAVRSYSQLPVALPPRQRSQELSVDPTLRTAIEDAYADLDRKVLALPDVVLRRPVAQG